MLGVFLPAFTRLRQECQDLLCPCDGMHLCGLDLGLHSHPKARFDPGSATVQADALPRGHRGCTCRSAHAHKIHSDRRCVMCGDVCSHMCTQGVIACLFVCWSVSCLVCFVLV